MITTNVTLDLLSMGAPRSRVIPQALCKRKIKVSRLRSPENPDRFTSVGGYFNECMNGFEYQVAAHMVYEGEPDSDLVEKGLAITKAVHERYGAAKRNPYNEIECGDHYARSMASYGVFLAACGYEYHGPKGYLAFAPRIHPEDFKAPFTTAEGWGTFTQKVEAGQQSEIIELRYGKLSLNELAIGKVAGAEASGAKVMIAGEAVDAEFEETSGGYILRFAEEMTIDAGRKMEVMFG